MEEQTFSNGNFKENKREETQSVENIAVKSVQETHVVLSNESNSVVTEKATEKMAVKKTYTATIREMMNRVKSEPKPKMVYSGIKEGSVGFIFGPPKSAKTLMCENFGMSIAAGEKSYLGLPIDIENRKTLFISLEEFYTGRTERNTTQVNKLIEKHGEGWLENYIVATEEIPRYLVTQEDWQTIRNIITEVKPGVVILDSLSRMHIGSIEDSKTGKELMKNLRELANDLKVTVVVIHHTHKLYNDALSIGTIAGSRLISQDADFMIGLNKTLDGKRYIKDVAFRYAPDDKETVTTFTIGDDCWLNTTGEVEEAKLLAAFDGRTDDINREKLFDFIAEKSEPENGFAKMSEIYQKFVETKVMSKPTAHSQLNHLEKEGRIIKPAKGEYKVAA